MEAMPDQTTAKLPLQPRESDITSRISLTSAICSPRTSEVIGGARWKCDTGNRSDPKVRFKYDLKYAVLRNHLSLRGYFSESHSQTQLYDLAQTYLAWSHGQPVTLFDPETFVNSIHDRNSELLNSLRAITGRFPPGTLTMAKQQQLSELATSARRAVMMRVTDGEVELSTLQSLCILSIVDFAGASLPIPDERQY
jgi:hypothetical protein